MAIDLECSLEKLNETQYETHAADMLKLDEELEQQKENMHVCSICFDVREQEAEVTRLCGASSCNAACNSCIARYVEGVIQSQTYSCVAMKCAGGCGKSVSFQKWSGFAPQTALAAYKKAAKDQLTLQCIGCHQRGSLLNEAPWQALPQHLVALEPALAKFQSFDIGVVQVAKEVVWFWENMKEKLVAADKEVVRAAEFRLLLAAKFMDRFVRFLAPTKTKIDRLGTVSEVLWGEYRKLQEVESKEKQLLRGFEDALTRKKNELNCRREELFKALTQEESRLKHALQMERALARRAHTPGGPALPQLRSQVLHAAMFLGANVAKECRQKLELAERQELVARCGNSATMLHLEQQLDTLRQSFKPEDEVVVKRLVAELAEARELLDAKGGALREAEAAVRAKFEEHGAIGKQVALMNNKYNEKIAYQRSRVDISALQAKLNAVQAKLNSVDPHEKIVTPVLLSVTDTERRATLQLRLCNVFTFVITLCCKRMHCFICKTQGAHAGETCEQRLAKQGLAQVKICPACGLFLVKGDGCDSIKCVCGHGFGWSSVAEVK